MSVLCVYALCQYDVSTSNSGDLQSPVMYQVVFMYHTISNDLPLKALKYFCINNGDQGFF